MVGNRNVFGEGFTAVVVHWQGSTISSWGTHSVLRVLLTMELWHSDILPSRPPGQGPLPASLLSLAGTVWMTKIRSLICSHSCPIWSQTILNSDRVPWFSTGLGLESALSYAAASPADLLPPQAHLPQVLLPFQHQGGTGTHTELQGGQKGWEDHHPGSGEPWREGCWVRTSVLA